MLYTTGVRGQSVLQRRQHAAEAGEMDAYALRHEPGAVSLL